MKKINRLFPLWALLSLVIPTALGFVLHGFTAEGALRGLVWGGLVRAFFLHHITWSINSVCHYFGRRRFDIEDLSTNVAWLALPSLGEAWHHNHHAFPRSAHHGLRRREIDISGYIIGGDGERRAGLERRPHLARAPGGEAPARGRGGEDARRRLSYQAVPATTRRGGSSRTTGAANGRITTGGRCVVDHRRAAVLRLAGEGRESVRVGAHVGSPCPLGRRSHGVHSRTSG